MATGGDVEGQTDQTSGVINREDVPAVPGEGGVPLKTDQGGRRVETGRVYC